MGFRSRPVSGQREVMDAWPPSDGEAIHTSTFLRKPARLRDGAGVPQGAEVKKICPLATR